ncbi:MAG: hypothetical protein ACKVVP_05410 [Chloroflexota bacterium]
MQISGPEWDLARWLLMHELDGPESTAALPEAAERVCQKLCQRLAALVTVAGSQALLGRAIYLATADSPFLVGVRVGNLQDACLDGLSEHIQAREPGVAAHGLLTIVARLIGLLFTFIGEDLAMRLMRDVWPGIPSIEADFSSGETTP